MIKKSEHPMETAPLFSGWDETLIWSCLQGVMGSIYINTKDDADTPVSAIACLGDFLFYAGKPDPELVRFQPEEWNPDFMILVPPDDSWGELIEQTYGERARLTIRYALKKEPDVFDRKMLETLAKSVPAGVEIRPIDAALYQQCRTGGWSKDLVSQFADVSRWEALGLGMAAVQNGEVVSGASSYTRYRDGIEIEVDTRADMRRRGLATACSAKLILECLDRGLYPSWDAQNRWSLALAQKLGYHFDCEYAVYEINGL